MSNETNATSTRPLPWKTYKEAISDIRDQAKGVARESCTTVRSRGFWLNGTGSDNQTMQENADMSSGPMTYKAFLAEAQGLIDGGAIDISLNGGFDGADSLYDLNHDAYEPWVSDWSITVWTREQGWVTELEGSVD